VSEFQDAERAVLAAYGVEAGSRDLRLADPALSVRVLECGAGDPLVLVHGSGMSAPTWAPMLAHLADRRVHAVDLPGFGLSDPYDYSGRSLREHAVAQLTSLLDALGLDRVAIAGTSLGGMWALNLASAHPQRVRSVVSLGIPAVSLPGMKADPFFRAMTTPGVRALVSRVPPPRSAAAARRAMKGAMGRTAAERLPDVYFDVVRTGMRAPGWKRAMLSHLGLGLSGGKARPECLFSDDELRAFEVPVLFVMGDADVYGPPSVVERAAALMPGARVEVMPGGHAPFLDDPERCARLIRAWSGYV
jgi:pimeloyl-[acyl-carrier protein] methyl ester esterase